MNAEEAYAKLIEYDEADVVFVLVPSAIYDHGVIGVYTSPGAAVEDAEHIWKESDGHHGMVILPMYLNKTYDSGVSLTHLSKPTSKPVVIDIRDMDTFIKPQYCPDCGDQLSRKRVLAGLKICEFCS